MADVGTPSSGSLAWMKKVIVLLVIAAIAAVVWKVMTTEVDVDPAG